MNNFPYGSDHESSYDRYTQVEIMECDFCHEPIKIEDGFVLHEFKNRDARMLTLMMRNMKNTVDSKVNNVQTTYLVIEKDGIFTNYYCEVNKKRAEKLAKKFKTKLIIEHGKSNTGRSSKTRTDAD